MGRSDFLFARPNFLNGMARAIDIGSTLNAYNESETSAAADYRAVCSDWQSVGTDLRRALDEQASAHK